LPEIAMKIGIFHGTLPAAGRKLGGVEVFVHRLANALYIAGADVEVISLSKAPANAVYKHRQIFERLSIFSTSSLFMMFILPILLNLVRFETYDVVHFHGSDWCYPRRRAASVRTLHGSALMEARTATSMKRKLSQYVAYALEHLALRFADVVIGIGIEAKRIYKTDYVGTLFSSKDLFFPGPKTKDPSFVFIGTWEGRKRGAFVAESFMKSVLPRLPTAIMFMACDYVPHSSAIVNLTHPPDDALALVIRSSWALLSASTYEGFGLPYLEAMMSGTAIITTENSGADFVLDRGKYGCITTDEEFADKIIEIASNISMRQDYEARGLIRANEFSEAKVLSDTFTAYQEAINRASARASRRTRH
jgi:glycosyltransferase involved in cell wall biosynthesis